MRNKVIALVAALGIAFAVATPAKAQFWGPYYGGWGYGYGYGGYGYYAPPSCAGYYDAWGRWIYYPGCVDPYYGY